MLIFSPASHTIKFTKRAVFVGTAFFKRIGSTLREGAQVRFFTFLKLPYGASFDKLKRKYLFLLGKIRVSNVLEKKIYRSLAL